MHSVYTKYDRHRMADAVTAQVVLSPLFVSPLLVQTVLITSHELHQPAVDHSGLILGDYRHHLPVEPEQRSSMGGHSMVRPAGVVVLQDLTGAVISFILPGANGI